MLLTGLVLTCLLPAAWTSPAWSESAEPDDAAEAEQLLSEVREQLEKLEKQISSEAARRGDAEQALREAERRESGVRRKLAEISTALATATDRLVTLEAEAAVVRDDLATHVDELGQQLRAAYVSGQDDWLRSVLSQRDPAEVGRQLVYHSYIARQRNELIDTVQQDLEKLETTQAALDAERDLLNQTQAAERERLAELSEAREQRKVSLARLKVGIASQSEQAERLRTEAQDLEALVAELTRILTNLPIAGAVPFSERKGQMAPPAAGPVIRKFGQARADGRLRWEGLLVGAAAGDEVRAVHYGRVVYSDWLPGMGLLVVLEHGDGYLSLYGHNQDLVMEVGEWVDPGTIIAHVGDSGGQAVTGLYFEIRKNGAPQNPGPWLVR